MRHFPTFHSLPLVRKKIEKHIGLLQPIEEQTLSTLHLLDLDPLLKENMIIQSCLLRKGHEIKRLLTNAVFMSFGVLVLGCLAKLKMNLGKIESKLRALDRIVKDISKSKKKEE